MFYYWLIVAFFFLIMEMGSPGLFFFVSFFFGGLIAAIASYFTASIITQTVFFLSGTGISLFIVRYLIIPLLSKDRPHERTNVYALKGKQGFVLKDINTNIAGLVRINGQVWAARVVRDESVVVGDLIEVIDVRGAHLVVKKV